MPEPALFHLRQARRNLKLRVCRVLVDHRREQATLAAVQGAQALVQRHNLVRAKRNPLPDVYLNVAARGALQIIRVSCFEYDGRRRDLSVIASLRSSLIVFAPRALSLLRCLLLVISLPHCVRMQRGMYGLPT